jgi:hypothetical protein
MTKVMDGEVPVAYFKVVTAILSEQRSAVGIATGCGLDDRREFWLLHAVQIGSGSHPTSYPMYNRGSFTGGHECEGDHSPRTSAGVKKTWIYTSPHIHVLMAQWLVKYRNNFTLLLLSHQPGKKEQKSWTWPANSWQRLRFVDWLQSERRNVTA